MATLVVTAQARLLLAGQSSLGAAAATMAGFASAHPLAFARAQKAGLVRLDHASQPLGPQVLRELQEAMPPAKRGARCHSQGVSRPCTLRRWRSTSDWHSFVLVSQPRQRGAVSMLNVLAQLRHLQRCNPLAWPLRSTRSPWQCGHAGTRDSTAWTTWAASHAARSACLKTCFCVAGYFLASATSPLSSRVRLTSSLRPSGSGHAGQCLRPMPHQVSHPQSMRKEPIYCPGASG